MFEVNSLQLWFPLRHQPWSCRLVASEYLCHQHSVHVFFYSIYFYWVPCHLVPEVYLILKCNPDRVISSEAYVFPFLKSCRNGCYFPWNVPGPMPVERGMRWCLWASSVRAKESNMRATPGAVTDLLSGSAKKPTFLKPHFCKWEGSSTCSLNKTDMLAHCWVE